MTLHPAAAATTSLPEINTGATNTQQMLVFVGYTAALVGVAVGALHFFQHRDDLWGTGYRVLGGVVAGYIVTHAPTIMGWAGTAAVF